MNFVGNILIATCAILVIETNVQATNSYHYLTPNRMKWVAMQLRPDLKYAVLTGNPNKNEFFIVMLKLPANYYMPPHLNIITEYNTVLSGTFYISEGKKPDKEHAIALNAGGFVIEPANSFHSSWTKDQETILQVSGFGPWGHKNLQSNEKKTS